MMTGLLKKEGMNILLMTGLLKIQGTDTILA